MSSSSASKLGELIVKITPPLIVWTWPTEIPSQSNVLTSMVVPAATVVLAWTINVPSP